MGAAGEEIRALGSRLVAACVAQSRPDRQDGTLPGVRDRPGLYRLAFVLLAATLL
ncbi:MAG: hypothetical protein IPI85_11160 [Dehalococcoidia bacterium]|nr:hypothetical protein [Dehalococcoidia bacterium]